MTDETHIELRGEVIDVSKGGFQIKLENSDQEIFARLSGKLRVNKIRVLLGDKVAVKVSVYDMSHGILCKRF